MHSMPGMFTDISSQYQQAVAALRTAGILDRLGDAKLEEYPLPALEQVQDLVDRNRSLAALKIQQGFTRLQLTPFCMPVLQLAEAARMSLKELALQEKLFQSQSDPDAPVMPVQVNRKDPLWMWERLKPLMDSPAVVYFPRVYAQENHGGLNKAAVLHDPRFCAFPGWSVGLVEPYAGLPQPGKGSQLQGRQQLETYRAPREYLQTLQSPPYIGETGWTLEDFLVFFLSRLVQENRVSFDRQEGSSAWLLGAYVPGIPKTPNLVLTGYWHGAVGHKLYLSAHRTGNHFVHCGAPTMARLGMITHD